MWSAIWLRKMSMAITVRCILCFCLCVLMQTAFSSASLEDGIEVYSNLRYNVVTFRNSLTGDLFLSFFQKFLEANGHRHINIIQNSTNAMTTTNFAFKLSRKIMSAKKMFCRWHSKYRTHDFCKVLNVAMNFLSVPQAWKNGLPATCFLQQTFWFSLQNLKTT